MVIVQQAEVKLSRIARGTPYMLHLGVEHPLLKHVHQLLRHVVVDVIHAGRPVAHVVQPLVESLANPAGRSRVQVATLFLVIQTRVGLVLMPTLQLNANLRQHVVQPAQRVVHLLRQFLQPAARHHQFPRQHLFGQHVEVNVHIDIQRSLLPHPLQHLFRQGLRHLSNVSHHSHQPVSCTSREPFFPQTGEPLGDSSQYNFAVHRVLIQMIVIGFRYPILLGLQRYKISRNPTASERLII